MCFMNNNLNIDFVVTWLDSSDPKWQEDFKKYKGIISSGDQSKARYRDWDLFRYWFRAIEIYAPWVHKVYLITNGKFPDWINHNNPKLVLVSHSDYIPQEFLPTFNSRTIEIYMNRIKGLSEHFVYFNDDMFLNAPITPDYYYKEGLPCDKNAETVYNVCSYDPTEKFSIKIGLFMNICVVNGHFKRKETVKQSFKRWYGFHLNVIDRIMSFIVASDPNHRFIGFRTRHVEQPYLKSVFDEAWKYEPDILTKSSTRFREDASLTPYFFRYWQFASNKFYPVKLNQWRKYILRKTDVNEIVRGLNNSSIKSICLNDESYCTDEDYEFVKPIVHAAFDAKFPSKSSFEI